MLARLVHRLAAALSEPVDAGDPDGNALLDVLAERQRNALRWGDCLEHLHGTGPRALSALRLAMQDLERLPSATMRDIVGDEILRGQVAWASLLSEEVLEALEEREPTRLRSELAQVAAVALAWMAALERRHEIEPSDRRRLIAPTAPPGTPYAPSTTIVREVATDDLIRSALPEVRDE